MNNRNSNIILEQMLEALELPFSAYDKAKTRYEDLGEWFSRPESLVKDYDPHIFSQGSFRLGTAIRPLNEDEAYDLDLGCKLRKKMTVETHTQKQLKDLVGQEVDLYRVRRGIQSKPIPKHRCWRLEYRDDVNFHMDIVPSIPARQSKSQHIAELMIRNGATKEIALADVELTSVITDDRLPSYNQISDDWKISNPEGYAKWFERQVQQFDRNLNSLEKAKVDKIPFFKRKTPLQKVIQLLKRHRDQLFKEDGSSKPISIVITTLATQAYDGEQDLSSALMNVLSKMGNYVRPTIPRVPNPVDPEEDFADRWGMQKYKHLKLEEYFWKWLQQAKIDFESICLSENIEFIGKQAQRKFAVTLNANDLSKSLNISVTPSQPRVQIISEPARPWMTTETDEKE